MNIDMRVAELLSSRLCHDLISPVGAVSNGLELLEEEESGMASDALELSIRSVRRASALLQFYRIAYGAAGSTTSAAEAKPLAAAILEGGKIRLDWRLDGAETQTGIGKLLLNLLLVAIEALPRGGEIVVGAGTTAGTLATATATGQDARLSEEMRTALTPDVAIEALTARTVQGYFLTRLAEALGGRLDVSTTTPGTVQFAIGAR